MKLEIAVLCGAAIIAASVALTNHYEMEMRSEGGLFRLNRWTGEIAVCSPALAPWDASPTDANAPKSSRSFLPVCQ